MNDPAKGDASTAGFTSRHEIGQHGGRELTGTPQRTDGSSPLVNLYEAAPDAGRAKRKQPTVEVPVGDAPVPTSEIPVSNPTSPPQKLDTSEDSLIGLIEANGISFASWHVSLGVPHGTMWFFDRPRPIYLVNVVEWNEAIERYQKWISEMAIPDGPGFLFDDDRSDDPSLGPLLAFMG